MTIPNKPSVANPDLALVSSWGGTQEKPTALQVSQGFGSGTALGKYYASTTINWNNDYFFQWQNWCANSVDYIAKNTELYVDSGTANAKTLTILSGEAPTSYTDGMRVRFFNKVTNTGACTINVNSIGSKSLKTYDGDALLSSQLDANKYIEAIYYLASDVFVIANITFTDGYVKTDGTTPFVAAQTGVTPTLNAHLTTKTYVDTAVGTKADKITDFSASLTTNGYQKLPNGTILQWGTSTVNAGDTSGTLITFPTAFTTACFSVTGNAYTAPSGSLYNVVGTNSHSTTNFRLYAHLNGDSNAGGQLNTIAVKWFAIGY